jgi:hypothetical protein
MVSGTILSHRAIRADAVIPSQILSQMGMVWIVLVLMGYSYHEYHLVRALLS